MRLRKAIAAATAVSLAVLVATGCGGGGEDQSGDPADDVRVSVTDFKDAFAGETGLDLAARDLPGGVKLLALDQDGDPMNATRGEVEFLREYGNAQIYLVEDGDPELIFETARGETGRSEPAASGGDTVTIASEVAEEPDGDGVIWTRNCVEYEKKSELNTCAWTGTKRYGQNVIVTWTQTSEGLSEGARRLDEAVSAAVAGG
jgi:hypothetical protein